MTAELRGGHVSGSSVSAGFERPALPFHLFIQLDFADEGRRFNLVLNRGWYLKRELCCRCIVVEQQIPDTRLGGGESALKESVR